MTDRILLVSTQMEAGGTQVLATNMLAQLQSEGTEAAVVFLYRKRPVFDGVDGVEVLFPHKPGPFDLPLIVWRLITFVRKFRPTAIVGFAHYSSPLAALAGWLCGVKKRVGTQTSPPNGHSRFARLLDWLCGTTGVYSSNIAASGSVEACFDTYPRAYRRRLKTIYNGVRKPRTSLDRVACRKRFGLDADAFLILNTGRLSAEKNQSFLLETLALLPDAHLAILGEGEQRSAIERQVQDLQLGNRVTLIGEIAPDQVGSFLACGDVFAFPSRYEAFGLALVEAMLMGLPVVASDYSALVEVVGDAGETLPVHDPQRWAAAIERLRCDTAARLEASRRAASRGRRFEFTAMLDAFKAVWTAR
jgi:glycosyltransferase involved in cell wall biosynthesis